MTEAIQRSFSSGEITPSLYARVDNIKYATGLRTCRNYIVKRHGGVWNRPGTEYICEVKDSTKTVRIIPFIFNDVQTYVLEFGNQYMRVIRNAEQVIDSVATITNVTQANPGVVTTSAAHGFTTGQEVYVSGVDGMVELNNRNFKITVTGASTFSIQDMGGTNVNTTGYTAYSSGGSASRIYEIATPYLEADLMDIRFTQSADVITIVHPSYAPRELSRTGHTAWSLSTISFAPSIGAPTNAATNHPGGTVLNNYYVTALDEFGEESLASNVATTDTAATSSAPVTITWDAVDGATGYNIYREWVATGGLIGEGYIGTSSKNTQFDDDNIIPEYERSYPVNDNPFNAANDYPSCVSYYQSRLCFGNTNNFPETVWMSHAGSFKNLSIPFPSYQSSRVVFTMAGKQVNSIQHMIDIGRMIVFTSSGEWSIQGNDAGIVTPTDINPLQNSYNGTGSLAPIVANGNALYVQARGTVVRDLLFTVDVNGYSGNDLSLFSSHMFDDYVLVDWAYQQIPDSNIWSVRSDGAVLCLTYIREQEIFGWTIHDFRGGAVERAVSIPEGNEDTVYFVVRRTIDGRERRYIEKFASRKVIQIEDQAILDCHLTFDGRNYTTDTMTLSGGSTWAYDEDLTLTHSAGYFLSSDIGNEIFLYDVDGNIIRFEITGYTSPTVVTGRPHKTVPTSLRNTATAEWSLAVDEIIGLWHIEGETVSIVGDGFVVGSPDNPSYLKYTVSNGTVTLDRPHAVIHIGIPITADVQTLDIDLPSGETMSDKHQNITRVAVHTKQTRGLWAGEAPPDDDDVDPLQALREIRPRENESQEDPPALKTGVDFVNIKGRWNLGGRVFIRQIDPIPSEILAIIPGGYIPVRR